MKIVVLGGTGFIGRRIVEELTGHGHEVVVIHRGDTEVDLQPGSTHVHGSRDTFSRLWPRIREFHPDGLIDVVAYSRSDARFVLDEVPSDLQLLVLSSMDVYRACGVLRGRTSSDPVPLDEDAPVREDRYIYRSKERPDDDYEKLDVEEEYAARGANILRLPAVYGEGDSARREEFILQRCRANRPSIPIGAGGFLWSRGYVRDIAAASRLVVEAGTEGQVFNVCESRTWTMRQWAEAISTAARWRGRFVSVPDNALPRDLWLTGSFEQHLLFASDKIREHVGWVDSDPEDALNASVRWHLAHPPNGDDDFTADDAALLPLSNG